MSTPISPFRAGFVADAPAVHAVVPAAPGFFALELCWDLGPDRDKVTSWSKTPVTAWLILADGCALPSGPHMTLEDLGNVPVLSPDGEVLECDRAWASIEAWFTDAKKAAEGNVGRAAA